MKKKCDSGCLRKKMHTPEGMHLFQ